MGMAAGTIVPLEEYLRTSYEPDCEYVDGELVERNAGSRKHSRLQGLLVAYLMRRRKTWGSLHFPKCGSGSHSGDTAFPTSEYSESRFRKRTFRPHHP